MNVAARIATNAPVATWGRRGDAAPVGVAVAVEAADSEPEAAEAEGVVVEAELLDEVEALELLSAAVALRVPHC